MYASLLGHSFTHLRFCFQDFISCVTAAQRTTLKFPSWNPDACKIGMCSVPGPGEDMSILGNILSTSDYFPTILALTCLLILQVFIIVLHSVVY